MEMTDCLTLGMINLSVSSVHRLVGYSSLYVGSYTVATLDRFRYLT